MLPTTSETTADVQGAITSRGFAFVHGAAMREMFASAGTLTDWDTFRDSWNRLELDTYMADGGRYRRRRHATFSAVAGGPIVQAPHQPHFQSLDYNPIHGGIERWFEPIEPLVVDGASLQTVLGYCRRLFDVLVTTPTDWHIEVHQFRIEARPNEQGRPTPEGLHRDGVDYVLVLLIQRRNIASGVTAIHALDGRMLGQFTLTEPFDVALVDDTRVAHGVTPVESLPPHEPAYRDVLVVTFRRS
ncbi:MAG: 2OG-Fe dioxygenase family protein [Acidobacteriaceae bacterium]|nr:2OG-Fe dioxygenase family protein [Acidobacteriaceae bacterium]